MSTIHSLLPPRTRQLVKKAIGIQAIQERLGAAQERLDAAQERLGALEGTVKSISVDGATYAQQANDRLGALEHSVDTIRSGRHDPRKTFSTAFWYDPSYAEPCVALAIRDLCRPGDVVFDVGANCGALSILMSRLVGPRGVVCSFEASRRIVDKCQYNLAVNGCYNTQLFHRAVFSQSGEILKIYHGTHLNDTVVAAHANTTIYDTVETITLDDFVRHFQLHPKLIKIDIEGAEYDALLGGQETIGNGQPTLLLEQQPSDTRCSDMLRGLGYVGIDLATYQEVASAADFPAGVDLANVLFIHRGKLDQTPYRLPIARSDVCRFAKADFRVADDGSIDLNEPFDLEPGRYLIRTDFTAQGRDNEAFAGVAADGATIFRYHTNSRFLSTAYRDWVIELPRRQSINLFLRFLNGTSDPTLDFYGASVYSLAPFLRSKSLQAA
jgi:FkbM family methyltransferase